MIERSKQLAAWTAVDEHVLPEYRVSQPSLYTMSSNSVNLGYWDWIWLVLLIWYPQCQANSNKAPPFHMSSKELSVKVQKPTRIEYSYPLVRRNSPSFLGLYQININVGFQSKELIVSSGLSLGDVDQYPTIDVTLDGADESVTSTWNQYISCS